MLSEAVSDLVQPRSVYGLDMQRYVTDIRGFAGLGDSFPEHKRCISVVLMIVVKYLAGQFFFLMCKYRAVNTFAHRERYEVKGCVASARSLRRRPWVTVREPCG